ncbi:MAG: PDZ domain-containing protein [Lachnospiraceae bacterium]|nr:PDZ domain-containing protein [Lachnospiraceae bacterium]
MENNVNSYYNTENNNQAARAEGDVIYSPNYGSSHQTPPPKKKKERRMGFFKVLAVSLVCSVMASFVSTALLAAVVFIYVPGNYMKKTNFNIGTTIDKNNVIGNTSTETPGDKYTVSEIAELMLPSVVAITSTSYINAGNNPFLHGYSYQVTGAGSGIIIGQNEKELLIVTNDHVVEDTTELTIEFVDGKSYDAYVKGTRSSYDIAVVAVKINDLEEDTLTTIKLAVLGDSDTLQVGEEVVAIGNALGYGQSVTDGIVSALNREVSTDSYTMDMIQTNAAINGGNSGGALINMYGEVIGINAAKTSSNSSSEASVEGMGYAIPISDVEDIITELMNAEIKDIVPETERGYLGVGVVDLTDDIKYLYGIDNGVYVSQVYENSGAKDAGIYAGDVITAIGTVKIHSVEELSEQLQYCRAGEKISVTIMANMGRGKYEEMTVEVVMKSYDELYK